MNPSAAEPDDRTLLEAGRRGDHAALSQLLHRHHHRMFGLCLRIVHDREMAADLLQDALVKVIHALDSYDGRASFTTWMTRIVINVCLSKLRSEKLRRHGSLDAPMTTPSGDRESSLGTSLSQSREQSAAQSVEEKEDREQMLSALSSLDPEQRVILLLRDQRGLDYEQIGDVLGIAVGTVKSRLFRARAALREAVEVHSRRRVGAASSAAKDSRGRQTPELDEKRR
jgi:RNA polymerase sigma-70 factor (ECF subfamily)